MLSHKTSFVASRSHEVSKPFGNQPGEAVGFVDGAIPKDPLGCAECVLKARTAHAHCDRNFADKVLRGLPQTELPPFPEPPPDCLNSGLGFVPLRGG
ncbi:MAG TPA: hypothetical protein VMW27_13635, partial [Thermoanaerobaculia bacterium]|nr:hypothetical protein [Thermoanaerobaculia bacterium]